MSEMVNLEVPWINIMSKMDLVSGSSSDMFEPRNGKRGKRDILIQARYYLLLRETGGINNVVTANFTT
ncbi:hypothetical protein BDR04DRAFT_1088544 [Suillus decipiens]|nr:hypothetical protein BDR04DRAFT_1088544 [Suillus decipiens]